MADASITPAVIAGLGGVGAAVGILYLIEQQGIRSQARLDEALRNKLESKIDGGEAKNQFGGSDQTLDALIANMEAAQVWKHHARMFSSQKTLCV
jgi:hypothetical protein